MIEVHSKDLLDKVTFLIEGNSYHITVDQEPLFKGIETFMLYALKKPQGTMLSGTKYKVTSDKTLPILSSHLLSGKNLRGFLKKEISWLTMPLDIMFLDTLPLSANGELNKQALPVPNHSNIDLDRSSAEPLTFIEKSVCRIWEEILSIDKVDLYDNFFELGGHSLLATQAMSRIHDLFDVELSMARFFDTPTVFGLSKAIEESKIEKKEPREILAILNELDDLSDNEIKVLLAKEEDKS